MQAMHHDAWRQMFPCHGASLKRQIDPHGHYPGRVAKNLIPPPPSIPQDAGAGAAPAAGPGFQAVLTELLERLCRDHPFHALFQVLALKNGDRGRDGRRGVSRPGMTYAVDHAKVAAAEALVARLKAAGAPPAARELVAQVGGRLGLVGSCEGCDPRSRGALKLRCLRSSCVITGHCCLCVWAATHALPDHPAPLPRRRITPIISPHHLTQMEMLVDVYIELAAAPAPKDGHPIPFPAALRRSTRAMPRVPVASASLAVDPSCRYEDVPTLMSFGDRLTFVGGINRPKLVSCVDSAGREHRQLVRGCGED